MLNGWAGNIVTEQCKPSKTAGNATPYIQNNYTHISTHLLVLFLFVIVVF